MADLLNIDAFTLGGARRHKNLIDRYWSKRGLVPTVRLEPLQLVEDTPGIAKWGKVPLYVIRSDMLNGLPRAV